SNLEQQILSAGAPTEAREGACAPHPEGACAPHPDQNNLPCKPGEAEHASSHPANNTSQQRENVRAQTRSRLAWAGPLARSGFKIKRTHVALRPGCKLAMQPNIDVRA